ncbi:MAG: phosphoglucomutase/phosphomannomutase family protein [Dehalococcoidia bacterium]
MSAIKFGTDGWRAVIGDEFTFANVRACAQGVASYVVESGLAGRGLVVGYDTRFAAGEFAAAVAEVLAANGIGVYLCPRPAPTPVVSHSILERGAGGAVIITASHNPAKYLGFKFRPEYGGSAPPEVLAQVEARIDACREEVPRLPLAEAKARGLVEVLDPRPVYLKHLAGLVDLASLRAAGLKVVVDSMHGAAAGYLPALLRGGQTKVREIRSASNPLFPGMDNPEPIERNLRPLSRAVLRHKADVGLATDGDGDRLGIIDERGRFIDQLQTFALLAYYLLEVRGTRGPLVKSVTTTSMITRLGELYGVPVHETGVGFKYLGPKMMETDALIAGEESGGYAFRGHLPERDGILSGLYFLDLMARRGSRPTALLGELCAKVGPHYYDRLDIALTEEERQRVLERVRRQRPAEIGGLRVTGVDTQDGFRYLLDGSGWALIRFSGTEPLLRIYTEVKDKASVSRVLQACRELAGLPGPTGRPTLGPRRQGV